MTPSRKGKVHKRKVKKSVSFAFTHTYTLEKLTLLLFFPQANMENFEKRFAKMWGGEGDILTVLTVKSSIHF